jgi:LAS superfamily LD-carboxypeptidase LdcB
MTTSKKKKRHLRLRLPKSSPSASPQTPRRRHHRRLRKEVIYVLVGALAIVLLITIPRGLQTKALKDLGYDKATIANIRAQDLASTLIDNQYYSDYLAQCINDNTLNQKYLPFYAAVSTERGLSETDFLLIGRLQDAGYETDQIQNLLSNLTTREITPLLVFDYQPIEQNYIDDVLAHRETNSDTVFELSGTYYSPYTATAEVPELSETMLVNKTYYLPETFEPSGLTELSTWYAAPGRSLSAVGAEAFQKLCDAGRAVGVTFYATSAYRSYADQETIYNSYVSSMGQTTADLTSARPGFSEHQTGLAVDVAASNEDDVEEFKDTNAFLWLSTNCTDYGWILRYPEGMESITSYEYEPWHYRYVGVETAKAMAASGLTYDEYWCLYLKPWIDESNNPSYEASTSASADASQTSSTSAAAAG